MGPDGKVRHITGLRRLATKADLAQYNLETVREFYIELLRLDPDAVLFARNVKMAPFAYPDGWPQGKLGLEANFKGQKFVFNIRKNSSGGVYGLDGRIEVYGTPRSRGLRHSGGWTFEHEVGHSWHSSALEAEYGYMSSGGQIHAFQSEWDRVVDDIVAFGKKNSKALGYGEKFGELLTDEVVAQLKTGGYKEATDKMTRLWKSARKKIMANPDSLAPLGKVYKGHIAYNSPFSRAATHFYDVRLQKELVKAQAEWIKANLPEKVREKLWNQFERMRKMIRDPYSWHYRFTDRKEFFADGFAHYMNEGDDLKYTMPEFYEWLKENVFGGKTFASFRAQLEAGLWEEGTALWKRADGLARLFLPPSQAGLL